MKPKYRMFGRLAFPALIVISSLTTPVHAIPLPTAVNGSLVVSSADNGAGYIVANGGVTPVVTILSGTVLTPDGVNPSIILNSGNYAGAFNGIFTVSSPSNVVPTSVTPSIPATGIITNAGDLTSTVAGLEGNNNQFTFYNTGTLGGGTSGIREIGDGSIIVNTGTISGTSASGVNGAFTADSVTVHNSGTISSGGTLGSGVSLASNGLVINSDTISATGNLSQGVLVGANGVVYNLDGATISGALTGISSLGSGLTVNNWGTITSTGGFVAITGFTGADTINLNAGSVLNGGVNTTGGDDDINITADYTGNVSIDGDVDGGSGVDDIIISADSYDPTIFDNTSALVTISEDILGGSSTDTIRLTAAGRDAVVNVLGDIDGETGADNITLDAQAAGLVLANGPILGGTSVGLITLQTNNSGGSRGAVIVLDGINGEGGVNTLNLEGGLNTLVDFTGAATLQDAVEIAASSGFIGIFDDVEGLTDLNKNESGTAIISGYNFTDNVFDASVSVQADNINVNAGALYINGEVEGNTTSKAIITVTNSALGGTNHWDADVTLAGTSGISAGQIPINLDWDLSDSSAATLSPTPVIDAIGTLEIHGDLLVNDTSFVRYDLGTQLDTSSDISGNGADLIVHQENDPGDQVSLSSTSSVRLSPTDYDNAVSDGRYVIIQSDTTISGGPDSDAVSVQLNGNIADQGGFIGSVVLANQGDTINTFGTNLASFTTLSVEYNGTGDSLIATVQHDYAGLSGLTANQSSIGAAIDSLVGSMSPQIQDFISALDLSDASTAVETIASLSPEGQLSQALAVANSNYRIHGLVRNHLAAVRSAGSTVRIPMGAPAAGMEAPAPIAKRGNVWGSISYDWQDYSDDDNDDNSSYDGDATAVTAGFDWRVAPDLVLGILIDGSSGDYDYDAGGGSDVDSVRVTAYGTWGASTGLYSDFLIGYGSHDLDSKRSFGGLLGGSSSSSTDADSWQAAATVGYAFGNEKLKHGPFGGLEYQKVDVDGYDEEGGIIPVSVSDYDVDSLRALIGYRVDSRFGRFSPYASLAYAHEFKDDQVEASASLAGAGFQVSTSGLGSAIVLTFGTGYAVNDSLSFDVGYRGEFSVEDHGVDSNGLSAGVNWTF